MKSGCRNFNGPVSPQVDVCERICGTIPISSELFFSIPKKKIFWLSFVTLHAKRGLMDFTENREFQFSRREIRVTFHAVKLGVEIMFTASN